MRVSPPCVATSERHAAEAGAGVLRAGGSAADAAIATAAALTVTEPTSNGLGGDLFALVWDGSAVTALAASGASPRRLDVDAVRAEHDAVPLTGWLPVTVPGQVSGWRALHHRFGRLPWGRLLAPAIGLAEDGFVVGPITAAAWARAEARFGAFSEWRRVFLPGGLPPGAGQRFSNPDLAASLAALVADPCALYTGGLAQRLVEHSRATGGALAADDLALHQARWVKPLTARYRDQQVVGMTAPTQGVVALQALAMLESLDGVHAQIEAVKLSFADAYATVSDRADPTALLSPAHVRSRAAQIGERAGPPVPDPGIRGGTVLLCVSDGTTVASVIQSNFHGFGSGIVVPGTGIALQNRGAGFRLDPGHPNALAPGKRPFHTILPALLRTADGWGAFGCMGGQMQPQGHVQLVTGWQAGSGVQAAIDAPRWRWTDDGRVLLESGFDDQAAADLEDRGHRVERDAPSWQLGGAQAVLPHGVGSDPRKDGRVVWV
ncbi:MAG: gamma-glutamyltranspeptidase/glutathione hydrolase [Myxococcota bacterium]